jgi:hypothetical protein
LIALRTAPLANVTGMPFHTGLKRLFYLAALAIIARVRTNGPPPPDPVPGRVVLAQSRGRMMS